MIPPVTVFNALPAILVDVYLTNPCDYLDLRNQHINLRDNCISCFITAIYTPNFQAASLLFWPSFCSLLFYASNPLWLYINKSQFLANDTFYCFTFAFSFARLLFSPSNLSICCLSLFNYCICFYWFNLASYNFFNYAYLFFKFSYVFYDIYFVLFSSLAISYLLTV